MTCSNFGVDQIFYQLTNEAEEAMVPYRKFFTNQRWHLNLYFTMGFFIARMSTFTECKLIPLELNHEFLSLICHQNTTNACLVYLSTKEDQNLVFDGIETFRKSVVPKITKLTSDYSTRSTGIFRGTCLSGVTVDSPLKIENYMIINKEHYDSFNTKDDLMSVNGEKLAQEISKLIQFIKSGPYFRLSTIMAYLSISLGWLVAQNFPNIIFHLLPFQGPNIANSIFATFYQN